MKNFIAYTVRVLFFLVVVLFSTHAFAKPRIVSTIGMIDDLVKQVVGEHIEARVLIGPGVDPHLYKATRSDIALLSSADVVFYNGLLLEGKITDALIRMATSGKKVVAVSEGIDQKLLLEPPEFEGHFDPHVWMNPKLWAFVVDVILREVLLLDPEHSTDFEKNAAAVKSSILALDAYSNDILKTVPKTSRVLVTAHDAFNYFGQRYDFEVVGIQGLSTESEAGVKDLERIVSLLVSRGISSVFIESTVSEKNVRALVEGAAANGHEVNVGGELFSDAMGKPGTYEGTYLGMIEHNVSTITKSLGGLVPQDGFRVKSR